MNLRPSGYEPDELPGCSIPRHRTFIDRARRRAALPPSHAAGADASFGRLAPGAPRGLYSTFSRLVKPAPALVFAPGPNGFSDRRRRRPSSRLQEVLGAQKSRRRPDIRHLALRKLAPPLHERRRLGRRRDPASSTSRTPHSSATHCVAGRAASAASDARQVQAGPGHETTELTLALKPTYLRSSVS